MTAAIAHPCRQTPPAQTPSVRIRAVRPSDRSALIQMHDRCSADSRLARWLGHRTEIPKLYLDDVVAGSPDHIAVIAAIHEQPTESVGMASAALTPDQQRDIGVLVEDRYQSLGIGTMLLDALVRNIDAQQSLCADALHKNRHLLAKLNRFGTVEMTLEYGIIHACVTRELRM